MTGHHPQSDPEQAHGWRADKVLRRLFANAGILLSGKMVNGLLNVAFMALAIRTLGPVHWGILVVITNYVRGIGDLSKFQSWQAVITYGTPARRGAGRGALKDLIGFTFGLDVISLIIALALVFAVLPFAPMIFGPENWPADQWPLIVLFALSVPFMIEATPTGILRLYDRFDLLAIQNTIGFSVRLAGTVVLFFLHARLGAFVVVWFIANCVAGSVLVYWALRELKRDNALPPFPKNWFSLSGRFDGIWKFVLATNFNGTLEAILPRFSSLIVNGILGPAAAGLYEIARQIADSVAKPVKMLGQAIYTEIAALFTRQDHAGLRRLILRSMALVGLMLFLAGIFVFFFADWILVLIGKKAALQAHDLLILMVAGSMILVLAFSLEPTLISMGRAASAFIIRLATTGLYLALMFFLLPAQGLSGAGWAALAYAGCLFALQASMVVWTLHNSRNKRQIMP